jgi:isoquinoline 1-oxidoreductase beta subunit
MNRRAFLGSAAAAGTGLVLAMVLPELDAEEELRSQPAAAFVPNAWLSIDKSGTITITVAKSEMGQGVRTSLPMIVAEELEADWTHIRIEQADAHQSRYGSQGTGGSSSVRRSWDMLRTAGAAAREMLIAAAAQEWSVPAPDCDAENGKVLHRPTGRAKGYGELVDAASRIMVPANPPLKDPANFHIIGTRARRLDLSDKVNGRASFGIDARVPGMLFAAIARPGVFGGKLLSFDKAKAKDIAGVREVLRFDDAVAVTADSTWAAFRGRDALGARWDEGSHPGQSSEEIWKAFARSAALQGTVQRAQGDARKALTGARTKVDAVYQAPFAAHATMEPMNCTAHVTAQGCEIWAPTQTPQSAQSEAAEVLGLPLESVTVHVTLLGGGFGRRLENDYVVEAVKVSKAISAPVQVVWSREDDMRHDFYRPATYNVLRAGIDRQGSLLAWTHRIVGPDGGGLVTGGSFPPYAIPNILIDSRSEETGVPIGAWRSVGFSQNCFVIESFMDEIAHASRKDPFEYRRALLSTSPRLRGALELAAEKAGWGTPLPAQTGRGIACVQGFGTSVAQVAEVAAAADGSFRVRKVVCAVDCGPVVNPDTVEAQIESAIAFGLTASIKGEITIERGGVQQENFDAYDMLRMDEMPRVEVHIVPSRDSIGGIGEPGVPPIAPAVANALFAATGRRIRRMPLRAAS